MVVDERSCLHTTENLAEAYRLFRNSFLVSDRYCVMAIRELTQSHLSHRGSRPAYERDLRNPKLSRSRDLVRRLVGFDRTTWLPSLSLRIDGYIYVKLVTAGSFSSGRTTHTSRSTYNSTQSDIFRVYILTTSVGIKAQRVSATNNTKKHIPCRS